MAEDQTPMKQEILESLLTPSEDVIVKDNEVRQLESLSAKLKEIISDKSSPYDDFPDFEPSEPQFSADFFELVSKIEEDGAETAIQSGMNQEILENWIANAKEIRRIRDEEDKNRLRSNMTKLKSDSSSSSYDKFKVPPAPAATQLSNASSLAARPRKNWADSDSDVEAEAEISARDWDKVSLPAHPRDKQKLIDDATSREIVPSKEQVDAAVKLIEGYGARKDPKSIDILRGNLARAVKPGLRLPINALGLGSMSQARMNGDISSQGDVGPDPNQCIGQIAKGEAKSAQSKDEGPVKNNMRAEILSEDEMSAKRKIAEQDLVNGKLDLGSGNIVNKGGVRCITISSEMAVFIAERLSFQRHYLAVMKEALQVEIKKPNGLIPDADLAMLILEAENLQQTPSTNLELFYEPTAFSAFMSSFPGMNDGTNLEAKIRNATRDATNIGYFARLGSFTEGAVLQKNESYKSFLVRMITEQNKLKSLPVPPNANLPALGFVVADDGVPQLLKGGFVCYKALQEIRYRRSAEPMVIQFVTDEVLIRAANGLVTQDEVEDILAKLKHAGFDGRPSKVNSNRSNGSGNVTPNDQMHANYSSQERLNRQQQQPPPGRGRAPQNVSDDSKKLRSKSPERKLGIYKKFVSMMDGKLANYAVVAQEVHDEVKASMDGESFFLADERGKLLIPLKFTQGNKSDRLSSIFNFNLPERAYVGLQLLRDICFGGIPTGTDGKRALSSLGEMYKEAHDSSWHTNRIVTATDPGAEKSKFRKKTGANARGKGGKGGKGGDSSRANASVTNTALEEEEEEVPALTGALTRFGK